ncbi:hypothetical protein BGZ65_003247, partial [Modicella reniformis]
MSTPPSNNGTTKPEVAIIGAGLGGLLLGQLLEQIEVPYHIYERATVVKPLGTAMALGPSILPVFEQLGLLDELKKFALPCYSADMYNANIEKLGSLDLKDHDKLLGTHNLIFARQRLYDLMLSRVPAHKVSHGKKVLHTEEKDDNKIHIYCADNTHYSADFVVGADGAYSTLRQNMYKRLDEKGVLPPSELEKMTLASLNMVGVAVPEDPDKYPQLKDPFCHFSVVVGENGSRSWGVMSATDNTICWSLVVQLSETEAQTMEFQNAEWSPESIESMYKEFENAPCPWGGTMGDVMKYTPKDRISKVFLEEKNFHVWYDLRTVLLGDACHKMLPGAGLGAVNAMQDAVVLANCIYNMTDNAQSSITAAFKEYHGQRHHRLEGQIKRSQAMTALMGGE